MKNTKTRYLVNFAALVLLFAAVVLMSLLGGSAMKLKITPSIWQCSYLIIMASSLNLVLGFLGQLSLGHCGFMAVGAYTAALISLAFQRAGVYTDKSGPAFLLVLLLSILAAGAAAALLGLLVGIPALRLKGLSGHHHPGLRHDHRQPHQQPALLRPAGTVPGLRILFAVCHGPGLFQR